PGYDCSKHVFVRCLERTSALHGYRLIASSQHRMASNKPNYTLATIIMVVVVAVVVVPSTSRDNAIPITRAISERRLSANGKHEGFH
uniref:Secreted protein n=1 Tax=Mesocestoides corti TaxID=53468 RepID=A0A5K3F6R0_MESCO